MDEIEMVLVPKGDAEWLAHWKKRCDNGRRIAKLMWRATLSILAMLGAVGFALNQWFPWLVHGAKH